MSYLSIYLLLFCPGLPPLGTLARAIRKQHHSTKPHAPIGGSTVDWCIQVNVTFIHYFFSQILHSRSLASALAERVIVHKINKYNRTCSTILCKRCSSPLWIWCGTSSLTDQWQGHENCDSYIEPKSVENALSLGRVKMWKSPQMWVEATFWRVKSWKSN